MSACGTQEHGFNQVVMNGYAKDGTVSWHRDNFKGLGDYGPIASLNLGAVGVFCMMFAMDNVDVRKAIRCCTSYSWSKDRASEEAFVLSVCACMWVMGVDVRICL